MLWYDLETFGADAHKDRAAQFAAVRTDFDLNLVDEPINIFCKPALDMVPDPYASMVTGISPQCAEAEGLLEKEFCQQVYQQMNRPNSCCLGYNSIRFDDEVCRFLFYRNLLDPYQREWKNGNSRWDLLDVMRMTYALRPEGIQWPKGEEDKVSFKLELLTAANGIEHQSAHDAVSDVLATIELAKLVKKYQPRLWDFALQLRNKNFVKKHLDLFKKKPFLNFSGMFSVDQGCMAVLAPVTIHPRNRNEIICFDLMHNPNILRDLSAEQIRERLFTRSAELESKGLERVGLKSVHVNRSPMVAPISLLEEPVVNRWNLDLDAIKQNALSLSQIRNLDDKLNQVFHIEETHKKDPDIALYDGFINDSDRSKLNKVIKSSPEALSSLEFEFDDPRLPDLLFRYRARNWPELLSSEEHQKWIQHCREKCLDGKHASPRTIPQSLGLISELMSNSPKHKPVLMEVKNYLLSQQNKLN